MQADGNHTVKKVDGDRYECMVYLQLKNGLEQGGVFINDSHGYRALEDELIDIKHWEEHKRAILNGLNMPFVIFRR